ncbi:murein L,D-transpeptidase YcbB/YkuD [Humitalea rosea]|uniref:Murein L,D-transpeptidase YcbB/YkuD n=1 Tax=Humitalea rosea TaxID=990373 RepID=A0A2W7IM58_9PROT|nr:L,D-transpeptidase family protein [Humitalea rosea]PZW48147.1 murein L,D-transpeptidase YcbB/YkuD [Humitalea rosea]
MRRRDALLLLAAAPALAPSIALGQALPSQALPSQALPLQAAASWDAALRLADRVRAMDADGLDPRAYGLPSEAAIATDPQMAYSAIFRAALAGMTDLLHGRVRVPLADRPDLVRNTTAIPLTPWIARLAQSAEPAGVLEQAALATRDMQPLRAALAETRAVAARGGWESIPSGGTLDPGSFDPVRIPLLRARLAAEDPVLAMSMDEGGTYGPNLLEAVRRWQAAQGVEVDGRVGRISLAMLNRPADWRVNQILAAMDMRRAAPVPGPGRRIEVNIPDFRLQMIEAGRVMLEMAVIVGRPDRATPMLNVTMTALQFNPPWGVPMRNAREDVLPKLRRDPAAVAARGFRFFQSIDGQMAEIDPTLVDWSAVNPQRFPYIIRQDAGETSALGRIKFIIPNRDDIYLHDTPDRHYFSRPDRAFSSGCIRLERPLDLVSVALDGTSGWSRERAVRTVESRSTSVVSLHRQIPVRLHYTTVMVENGRVRIRPDIYGLDQAYAARLVPPLPRLAARG